LAGWIKAEQERQWMDRAKARFAISADPKVNAVEVWTASAGGDGRPGVMTMDVLDLGLIVAAARFAAAERGLTLDQVA
jgi:hypothetical protein